VLAPADPAMSDFLWKNSARWLGLLNGTPTPTLLRLRKFYTDNKLDPAVLNAFLA